MAEQRNGYQVIPFSEGRRLISDAISLGRYKHNIHGLLEVDVTNARQLIRDYEADTGTEVSFTAFVIACLAKAVDSHKPIHAIRGRGKKVVVFDEVDVNTTIEIERGGGKIPILHIIRAANRRPYSDLSREIQQVKAGGEESVSAQRGMTRLFTMTPSSIRRRVFRFLGRSPEASKKHGGTVILTAVGMFGSGAGWGIPFITHTLAVTLGGIAEKPVVVDGEIEIREMMSVTVTFDHDLVDGAPAARFADHFKELIEGSYGLVEDLADHA